MKIVIPGGSGQVGTILGRELSERGHEVVVLGRGEARPGANGPRRVQWDGRTLGPWADELDGADVVINLAGRSVNCRYTDANMAEMMSSRVDSTRVVGAAIEQASSPPPLWLQMSTATLYAHRLDAGNDEASGMIGGSEPDVPDYWSFSVDIAKAWEAEQERADTPRTRRVALRTAMVMSPDPDGVFDVLRGMTRLGLGGAIAGGKQYVSWIHDRDFVRAILFLIEREDISGAVNVCAPLPLPQAEFMAALRTALGVRLGLPATRWMLALGAVFMGSDSELLLKSRFVIPGRLQEAGFVFEQPDWSNAALELVSRARAARARN